MFFSTSFTIFLLSFLSLVSSSLALPMPLTGTSSINGETLIEAINKRILLGRPVERRGPGGKRGGAAGGNGLAAQEATLSDLLKQVIALQGGAAATGVAADAAAAATVTVTVTVTEGAAAAVETGAAAAANATAVLDPALDPAAATATAVVDTAAAAEATAAVGTAAADAAATATAAADVAAETAAAATAAATEVIAATAEPTAKAKGKKVVADPALAAVVGGDVATPERRRKIGSPRRLRRQSQVQI